MKIVTRSRFAKMVGVRKRTLDRIHHTPETLPEYFPQKIQITSRRVGYRKQDVRAFVDGFDNAA